MIMHCKCAAILSNSSGDYICTCSAALPVGWRVCMSCQKGNHSFNTFDGIPHQVEDKEPNEDADFAPVNVSQADAELLMALLEANGHEHTFLHRKLGSAAFFAMQITEWKTKANV